MRRPQTWLNVGRLKARAVSVGHGRTFSLICNFARRPTHKKNLDAGIVLKWNGGEGREGIWKVEWMLPFRRLATRCFSKFPRSNPLSPTKQNPTLSPLGRQKRTYEQYLSCVPMDRVRLLGDKVMMLLRHESSWVYEYGRRHDHTSFSQISFTWQDKSLNLSDTTKAAPPYNVPSPTHSKWLNSPPAITQHRRAKPPDYPIRSSQKIQKPDSTTLLKVAIPLIETHATSYQINTSILETGDLMASEAHGFHASFLCRRSPEREKHLWANINPINFLRLETLPPSFLSANPLQWSYAKLRTAKPH